MQPVSPEQLLQLVEHLECCPCTPRKVMRIQHSTQAESRRVDSKPSETCACFPLPPTGGPSYNRDAVTGGGAQMGFGRGGSAGSYRSPSIACSAPLSSAPLSSRGRLR